MRGVLAEDRGPLPNYPPGDQSTRHIRVVLGELFDHGLRGRLEEQHGAVDRVGEGAAELEFTARHGGAGMAEMGAAEGRALFEDVGDVRIKEQDLQAREF